LQPSKEKLSAQSNMPWKVLYLFQIFSILSLCFSGKQEKKQAREIIPFGPFEKKLLKYLKRRAFQNMVD